MNRTALLLFLFSVVLTFVPGCLDLSQEYFINPDGSGKVICRVEIPVPEDIFVSAGNYGISPAELMAGKIEDERKNYQGIDVWRDESYDFSQDKKTFYYQATGYFRNLNDCYLPVSDLDMNIRYTFGYTYQGEIEIVLQTSEDESLFNKPLPKINLINQQRIEAMIKSRIRYTKKRLAMPGYISGSKLTQVFNLPSRIKEYSNFKPKSGTQAILVFHGSKILKASDSLMANDNWLGASVKYSPDAFITGWDSWMNQRVFGTLGPVRLLLSAETTELFDYAFDSAVTLPVPPPSTSVVRTVFDANRYYQIPHGKADNSKSPNAQIREAMALDIDGDYAAAIQRYADIIANLQIQEKYLARAHYQLGMCLFDNGYTPQALAQFEYVIDNFSLERVTAIKAANQRAAILAGTAVPRYIVEAMKIIPRPKVIATYPEMYAESVPADTNMISVTFDMPMVSTRWSYSSFTGTVFPEFGQGPVGFDGSKMTWSMPVKLQGGKVYGVTLNAPLASTAKEISRAIGFKAVNGMAAEQFVLVFTTMHDSGTPIFMDTLLLRKCKEINQKHITVEDRR